MSKVSSKSEKSKKNARREAYDASRNFGFFDGNVMSVFEASDALQAMLQSIEKMTKEQIIAKLRGFGGEPEGGFAKTSKEKLARTLVYKRIDGTKWFSCSVQVTVTDRPNAQSWGIWHINADPPFSSSEDSNRRKGKENEEQGKCQFLQGG